MVTKVAILAYNMDYDSSSRALEGVIVRIGTEVCGTITGTYEAGKWLELLCDLEIGKTIELESPSGKLTFCGLKVYGYQKMSL
jgi:hypothetical protein